MNMLKQLKIALPVIAAAMLCGAPLVHAAPSDQMKPMSDGMTQPQKVETKKAKTSDVKKAAKPEAKKSEAKKPEVKKPEAKKPETKKPEVR